MLTAPRRTFIRTAFIAAAGIAAPRVAGAFSSRLRVTRHMIPWDVARPIRIVHLTDVHVGLTTPKQVLDDSVRIAHKLRPSMVAMTGDYVNVSLKHAADLAELVSRLPKPVMATLGNHDHYSGAAGVTDALERGGAVVLTNRSTVLRGEGFELPIVGLDDGRTEHADVDRAFRSLERGAKPLVLTHFPNTADAIMKRGAGLAIAGHTHGGQIAIPGVTRLVTRAIGYRYIAGWYDVGDGQLYVSAGIGVSLEGLRGGGAAMPEIAVYDLMPRATIAERSSSVAAFDGGGLIRMHKDTHRFDDVMRMPVSDDL
jgi:predicted MPP superfamily phosphohydrolase